MTNKTTQKICSACGELKNLEEFSKRSKCRACVKAYNKAYAIANKEKLKACHKAYREANKDRIVAYKEDNKEQLVVKRKAYHEATKDKRKAYAEDNKEKITLRQKAHYKANKEKIAVKHKKYSKANKEQLNANSRAYYEDNKEELKAKVKVYWENNKGKRKASDKAYHEDTKIEWVCPDCNITNKTGRYNYKKGAYTCKKCGWNYGINWACHNAYISYNSYKENNDKRGHNKDDRAIWWIARYIILAYQLGEILPCAGVNQLGI